MRKITLIIISGLLLITLTGCGKVVSEDKSQALEGYIYDEQSGRYINETTGIWYAVENRYKIILPEEYFDPKEVGVPDGIDISERPDDVWELSEVREITIKSGDTLKIPIYIDSGTK